MVVQSHISESHDAVAFSTALHPEVDGRDIQLFDAVGLLTPTVRVALPSNPGKSDRWSGPCTSSRRDPDCEPSFEAFAQPVFLDLLAC